MFDDDKLPLNDDVFQSPAIRDIFYAHVIRRVHENNKINVTSRLLLDRYIELGDSSNNYNAADAISSGTERDTPADDRSP